MPLINANPMWKRQFSSTDGDNGYGEGAYGYGGYGDDDYESWWWTPAGMAIRYVIVALLFAFVLVFFVGGYYHARRRIRKGLPPLRYHRWMVRQYIQNPQQQYYGQYQNPPNAYQMESYAPPPPAYNHSDMPPPVYQPPEGASKVMADQSYVHVQPLPPVPTQEEGESSVRPPVPRH